MLRKIFNLLDFQFGEVSISKEVSAKEAKGRIGYYDQNTGIINICRENVKSNKELVHVCLHEYAHFLQHLEEENCFRNWRTECEFYGYENHPLEVAAEQFAELWFFKYKEVFDGQ